MRSLVLELRQQGVRHVRPDLAEGALSDVPEGDPSPELVGVDLAIPADAADPVAGTVPLVHPEEFQDLRRPLWVLLEKAEIDRVGIFPFYPEEGTVASLLEGQISDEIKLERVERLSALQERISFRRQKRFEGRIMKVLVEEVNGSEGYAEGRSFREAPEVDGVIEIGVPELNNIASGEFAQVRIIEALEHDLLGEVFLT